MLCLFLLFASCWTNRFINHFQDTQIFHKVQPKRRKKRHSYHKGEALNLGYLVATGDLHCVSWCGKVPTEHWGTLHLSPPKHNPPTTTHRLGIIPCCSHPAFILIQWLSSALQKCTKRPSTSGILWAVFLFFPQFVMRLFVAKGVFEWDMAPEDSGEWKVWMQWFFPAIFQLRESCVECGRLQERGGSFLTFFLQHNNPY